MTDETPVVTSSSLPATTASRSSASTSGRSISAFMPAAIV